LSAEAKSNLRSEVRERRAALPPAKRREESEAIVQRLRDWLETRWLPQNPGEPIALYLAMEQEASLDALAEWLWARHVPVLAPRVDFEHQILTFHPLYAWADATKGPWQVRQPPALESVVPKLVLIPGMAFDLAGGRLGMGGGWYDRTLNPAQYIVGVALRCQLVPSLPLEPHDRRLDALVTPDSWHEFHPV
jgi:5-formyltetrahydrofolate cyclo-ligase